MATMKFGFGQPLTRKEDDALLRGAGTYIADVAPQGALHAVVLRSTHAHARISIGDLSAVKKMKGVRLVLTTPGVLEGVDIKVPHYPILALDVVRHVGDAIVFVVADTLEQAKDAAEAIAVDYQPLPHVIGAIAALKGGAPSVWPDRPNLAFETTAGDEAATKKAFAQAARTISTTIINQRLVTNYMDTRGVYTNTVPVDAYRGAGRPEASYLIERAVDTVARELGVTQDAIRRKNLIKPKALPYTTPTGKVYDSGDFAGTMARAQELIDWSGFNKRAAASKRAGKLRGIGIGTYVEACGANGPETAHVTLDRDGGVTVLIGSQSTGQGHQTSYAQLVAERLDLPPERVRVLQGDTDKIPTGAGTGGSSSIPVGGVSVDRASKTLAEQLKELAADALEASSGDMEIANGAIKVVGTDKSISFADLAAHPKATPEKLTASKDFSTDLPTFPNGTHIAEIEIDADTGATEIITYVVVDDFGATLNPLLLAGQVHGGLVQGIGQALLEDTVYDVSSGQLLSASFMDYAMPRAAGSPSFVFETRNTPCKNNPLGVKGAGEAGAIGSCPAVIHAVIDALDRAYGIRHIDMPATPQKIWSLIDRARKASAA